MSYWKEIRDTFINEEERKTYVDGYKTCHNNEEGEVIAKVDESGKVEYLNEKAKTDTYAQEVIADTQVDMLSEKAYQLYVLDWKQEHKGSCFDGCEQADFGEFKDNEFRDEDCMKYLLNDEDFKTWLSILG